MSDPWGDLGDPWSDVDSASGRSITLVTRRTIFDYFRLGDVWWAGQMDEVAFLARLYDLDAMPSTDPRFSTAAGDIRQHRFNNHDWDDEWIFTDPRLRLASGPDDVLLEFLCQSVHPVVRPDAEDAARIVTALNDMLRPDGWQLTISGRLSGRPVYTPARLGEGAGAALRFAHETATRVDSAYISRQVTRMEEAVQSDPDLAIGTAKEFIETVCKTILDALNIRYSKNDDLPALVKNTTKALGISRDDVDPAAPAADTIKRILSNLGQIAQGTAELRNAYGTGHGRSGNGRSALQPRHARLVVGAAAALASFLYDTYEYRQGDSPRV